MAARNWWTWYTVLGLCLHSSHCQDPVYTSVVDLKEELFTNNTYDYRIRPINNQSAAIAVSVDFHLLAINELNEQTESLKTTGYLNVTWYDYKLTWTPATEGYIKLSHWPQNEVWKPDISLKNSFLDYKALGDSSLLIQNNYTGNMTWTPFQVFQTTCSFDVTFYPFDIQDCDFKFTAWSYTKAQVTMQAGDNGFVFDEYEPNSNWDVKKFSWTIDENSDDSTIIFTVRIQRKPMYFLLTVVLPVLFLAVMDLFTFVLPSDSGEKVSYAVTVFLTFAVFLTIVSSTLPQSSDKVAIIAVFLLIQTGNSAGITLFAVALVRINNFTESTRIPCPLVALMNFFKCRVCRRKNDVTEMNSRNNKVSTINRRKSNVATANRRKSNVTATKMDSDEDFMDEEPYTWKDVSDFLDYFCFILFVSILTLSTLICLNMASVGV